MLEFKVYVNDKPGELARVTEALAINAVNIRAIASEGSHDQPFLKVVTNDVNTTRKALSNAGMDYEENEIFVLDLIDRPGELAKVARRLARASINISSIYILGSKEGHTQIAITVDDKERARSLLKAE